MVLMIHGVIPVIVIVAAGRSHRRGGKGSSVSMWSEDCYRQGSANLRSIPNTVVGSCLTVWLLLTGWILAGTTKVPHLYSHYMWFD